MKSTSLIHDVYTQIMLMARHQKTAKLFDEEFWGDTMTKSGATRSLIPFRMNEEGGTKNKNATDRCQNQAGVSRSLFGLIRSGCGQEVGRVHSQGWLFS